MLRTNYKDDVFTGDRKYEMRNNIGGTVSFTDVTEYDQVGDNFGAGVVNEQNTMILKHEDENTIYQKTLTAGATTVTFENDRIDSNSCFYFYADKAHSDLMPDDWSVSGHVLTATYDAQSEDVVVGVQILRGVVVNG